MTLLEELESRGITAEDLEKAASVRLLEKAAAAEGVELESLDQETVEELYSAFVTNSNLSSMGDEDNLEKEANAMINEEIVELFEKQAEAEGIDLDALEDAELANMYNHYVDNVLPEQVEDYQNVEVEEAHAKLAEAEILGRHMARAYMDEIGDYDNDKIASDEEYDFLPDEIEIDLDEISAADLLELEEAGYEFDAFDKEAATPIVDTNRDKMVRGAFGYTPKGKSIVQKIVRGTKETLSGKQVKRAKKLVKKTSKREKDILARRAERKASGANPKSELSKKYKDLAGKRGKEARSARKALRGAQLRRGGAIGALGLGAAGAGYAVNKAMKKSASYEDLTLDEIIELRALEMLEEAGYEVE